MNEQTAFFDWGRIEWLYEPKFEDTANLISIGIQTISPGKMQALHIHHGDEQVLYVLSGTGRQSINGRESLKGAGSIFHIAAGSTHETENTGTEPLRELIISIPANHEMRAADAEPFSVEILQREFLSEVEKHPALKEIFRSFTEKLGLPVAYFNADGKIIIKAKDFPAMCQRCRATKKGQRDTIDCALYDIRDGNPNPQYTKPTVFVCKHGLSVIMCSVVCGKEPVGMIKGGHMRIAPEDLTGHSAAPTVAAVAAGPSDAQFYSKARVNAVLTQFERLNREVSDFYNMHALSFEAARRESTLQKIMNEDETLRETLRSKSEQMLDIRINNHFLFNTLNAIGSMAVTENAFNTYDSILSLSNMLRYTFRIDHRLVRLSEEISGLKYYLKLQKLRFEDSLRVNINIPEEIKSLELPFHCLQPIVENSFVHGFKDREKTLKILVTGKSREDYALITVSDNGVGMEKEALGRLRTAIRTDSEADAPSGLAMMYAKLKFYYEDDFSFKIKSSPQKGMRVEITLPLVRKTVKTKERQG
ncbi:MAG: histidine kinase [Clostridiales Family XIII bacterium]|jgi:mannose-6-phosphate isomerase-like protein (cupin superfamily)/ligand-binding sensor protein|nr:histidine kinase [Clostridiales Family XIII bacterium]